MPAWECIFRTRLSRTDSYTVFCRLMLIDAHALMFRFHHAYGKLLQSEAGEETSISYGFMKTLLALLECYPPPSHLVIVMDAEGKTFRQAALWLADLAPLRLCSCTCTQIFLFPGDC